METNNKLLAEFMGYTQPHPDYPNTTYWYKEGKAPLTILSFDTDWNWLMDVVEKIESLNFAIKVVVNEALIFCEDWESLDYIYAREKTKIEATYNACVEFVKWYNEQK
jgi:hypothetical protein